MIALGPCPCGGTYEETRVSVRIAREGGAVEIDAVPQGRCERCGGRVYTAAVLERIEMVFTAESR
jgi:YgiT-type zinc finger domain-containing protein